MAEGNKDGGLTKATTPQPKGDGAANTQRKQALEVPSMGFAKKEQSTAAFRASSVTGANQEDVPALPKLDGAEIGAYRISLARAIRQQLLNSSSFPFARGDGLLLELNFIKPIAAPTVTILKSSGNPELDSAYVELVTKAAEGRAHPGQALRYPYRIELAFWLSSSTR